MTWNLTSCYNLFIDSMFPFWSNCSMQIGNRFRCYPTKDQQQLLLQWIGCQRFIYNAKVQEDRYFRKFQRQSLALAGVLTPIDQKYSQFKSEETAFLKDVPSQVLRNGSVRFMTAYQRYFKRLGGRPAIKKKHGRQSVLLTRELFRFERVETGLIGPCRPEDERYALVIGTQKFPIGRIKYRRHRKHALPSMIYIAVEAGQWFVSFSTDDGEVEYSEADVGAWLKQFSENELLEMALGGDRGVAKPVATSTGQDFDFTPEQRRNLSKAEKQKRKWQRRLARRIKGSKRRDKAKAKVAKQSQKQARIRRDFAHKTSYNMSIDPRVSLFVFEDLKIQNMTASAKGFIEEPGRNVKQKSGLNKAILAAAWGLTVQYLSYKALRQHKLLIKIAPHGTSQECDSCGHTSPENRLSQSRFLCQACGYSANADDNAAKIIKKRGVRFLLEEWEPKKKKRVKFTKNKGEKPGTAGPAETGINDAYARGEIIRRGDPRITPQVSTNRETPTTAASAV